MSETPAEAARLPHGYTNVTERTPGAVRKAYLGPDVRERRDAELAALTGLAGRFPVPEVVSAGEAELATVEVPGWHGQEALDAGHAEDVLALCGRLRRELSAVDPATVPGLPGSGRVIVHGDFGPQNLLVTPNLDRALALLDWEWAHLGEPVEDLAWTEWIVRTHHPHLTGALPALYAGYGERLAWSLRLRAMLDICHRCLDFCVRWADPVAVELWHKRIAATTAFQE